MLTSSSKGAFAPLDGKGSVKRSRLWAREAVVFGASRVEKALAMFFRRGHLGGSFEGIG